MSADTKYFLSDWQDMDIALDNQNTSMISMLDILLLKKAINDVDQRILNEILEKVWRLGNLNEGWDSYQGAPISDNAIVTAHLFLSKIVKDGLVFKRPTVSPEPNGGVLLKWKHGTREFLTWFTSQNENCIYVEVFNGVRTGGKTDSSEELYGIFTKWLNQCTK